MEQFSHDLTLALALTLETSRTRVRRRRTCSTGNLPCAPQPTEDSSTDAANDAVHNLFNQNPSNFDEPHSKSDSDERDVDIPFAFKTARCIGNFESADSLNENFSPARFFRPNRRKRKLKRMTVEYETTPTTPGSVVNTTFPLATGAIKKRVPKQQESCYRTNLFFCGKRKRSHRMDRYYDYHDHHHHIKQHSSSAPRQCHIFAVKNNTNATCGSSEKSKTKPLACEKILPLNKCLVSKIEKISQQNNGKSFNFIPIKPTPQRIVLPEMANSSNSNFSNNQVKVVNVDSTYIPSDKKEMTFIPIKSSIQRSGRKKSRRHKRNAFKNQLQFEDPTMMECSDLMINDFLSSSSLSSSDSEGGGTNDSDREGDDELTDWPGNEAMVNFASKNDFKRRLIKKSNLPLIKSDDYTGGAEDDTLMSGDELSPPDQAMNEKNVTPVMNEVTPIQSSSIKPMQSSPIAINNCSFDAMQQFRFPVKQIESEMSGETSNHTYMPSPHSIDTFVNAENTMISFPTEEIREFRSGCRRINNERPGFTVKISVNERLSKFLQDVRQTEIHLNDFDMYEQESLSNLAKMYSLTIVNENGSAILKKTSNTTQSTSIDQHQFHNALFLSDYKRICYDGRSTNISTTFPAEPNNDIADITSGGRRIMLNEEQKNHFIQFQ